VIRTQGQWQEPKPQIPSAGREDQMATPNDIRERTFQFAVRVVSLVKSLPRTPEAQELGRQLLRSGTSIGANVQEADGAESKRDFVHKMSIARKEARETCYWLRLLQVSGEQQEELEALLPSLVIRHSSFIKCSRPTKTPPCRSGRSPPRGCTLLQSPAGPPTQATAPADRWRH
jgi:four helix bundle protein